MSIRDIVPFRKRSTIRRWEDPFRSLIDEMESIWDRFVSNFDIEPWEGRAGYFSPRVDFTENDKEYLIKAELPGLEEKDVEVLLEDDAITIRGEKKEEKEEKGKDYYYRERRFGSFSRTLPLPDNIDRDKIEAKFKNGLLTLRLPKTKESSRNVKKIEVKAA